MPSKARALARGPRTADMIRLFHAENATVGQFRISTMAAYQRALTLFEPHAPEYVRDLGRTHAIAYTSALIGRGLKPHSINDYQRPVWTWFTWLYRNDEIDVDIARKVQRFRVPEWEVTRRTVTDGQRARMVKVALSRLELAYRNAAIVETLYSTGLRRGELVALNMRDLDMPHGEVEVEHGKGGRPRTVGIGADARYALERYFARERGYDEGPLFLSRFGQRMTGESVKLVMDGLGKACGFKVSAHDFRRATAARMLSAGAPIDVVQHQLGHSDGDSALTLVYGAAGRARRSLEEFHRMDAAERRR